MKKITLVNILFLFVFGSKAQSVIASAGGEGTVGTWNINYTIGETFVSTYPIGGNMLTEGFHQPYYVMVAIKELFNIGEVKVYPNPTTSILQIQFDKISIENIEVKLFDLSGKSILASKTLNSNTWQADISYLPSATYILIVNDIVKHKANSYKIIKSN